MLNLGCRAVASERENRAMAYENTSLNPPSACSAASKGEITWHCAPSLQKSLSAHVYWTSSEYKRLANNCIAPTAVKTNPDVTRPRHF